MLLGFNSSVEKAGGEVEGRRVGGRRRNSVAYSGDYPEVRRLVCVWELKLEPFSSLLRRIPNHLSVL